ncbi:hypothetical protein MMYC01_202047 [Madurella mycetomatis]|uniref:Uncharacterized protein n=1 Tax=Madurella mycetomatis TaxID=100816 RepID=A0A175WD34_9PEZI|nr:hypothetical protein MMYC01_202047 [Madurella mycetomatis]
MYRPRHFRWRLMHVSGILAHFGLTIAAGICYIYNLGFDTAPVEWGSMNKTSTDMNPCNFALMGGFGNWGSFDVAVRTLLITCLIVGPLGAVINIVIFILLLATEVNKVTLTEGEQYWRKQIVTFFGCVLNLVLTGAGGALAGTLGVKTAESKSLIAPLIWALIQALLSLVMAVCDAVKNHREGKDLLD